MIRRMVLLGTVVFITLGQFSACRSSEFSSILVPAQPYPSQVIERISWSPDGQKIAFSELVPLSSDASNVEQYWQIHIIDVKHHSVKRLTNSAINKFDLAWSPDGGQIALVADSATVYDIYKIDIDNLRLTRLTHCADEKASCDSPAWSPDGKRIAFVYNRYGYYGANEKASGIYSLGIDGSDITLLTTETGGGLTWSPDGTKLLFYSGGLRIFEIDSHRVIHLTDTPTKDDPDKIDYFPTWSPGGKKIAFQRNYSIYTIGLDASIQNLPTLLVNESELPAWSPDGQKIAFISTSKDCRIATIDTDGTNFACLLKR